MCPFKDPNKAKEYHRDRRRKERAGAVDLAEDLGLQNDSFNPPLPLEGLTVEALTAVVAAELNRIRATPAEPLARGRCIGYLAGVLIKALEAGSVEARLDAIERLLVEEGRHIA